MGCGFGYCDVLLVEVIGAGVLMPALRVAGRSKRCRYFEACAGALLVEVNGAGVLTPALRVAVGVNGAGIFKLLELN